MGGWWVHDVYNRAGAAALVSWIFWVLLSITLHELAHGWTAVWQGDDTPRRLGRLTANPVVHMGPMSLLVFAVIGIAWGLMPIDPGRFRSGRWGRVMVSAAGPAMNLGLVLVAVMLGAAWTRYAPGPAIEAFFLYGAFLNLVLAGFNLLPVPPLDGSAILAGFSWRYDHWCRQPRVAMVGLFLMMFLLLGGLGTIAFDTCRSLADAGIAGLAARLP